MTKIERERAKESSCAWKTKFKSRLFPVSPAALDIEGAHAVKIANMPPVLYRYRGNPEFYLDEIANQHGFFSSPALFNDPYDSALTLAMDEVRRALPGPDVRELVEQLQLQETLSDEQISQVSASHDPLMEFLACIPAEALDLSEAQRRKMVDVFRGIMAKHEREMALAFSQALQHGMKVCCFSECNDSIPMWSHYAINHAGIVIAYSFGAIGRSEVLVRGLMPVFYENELFDGTPYMLHQIDTDEFNNLFGLSAAIHKAPGWAYEKEWRVVYPVGDNVPGAVYPLPPISSVYLGARTPESDKQEVIALAGERSIPVFEAALVPHRFALEFQLAE